MDRLAQRNGVFMAAAGLSAGAAAATAVLVLLQRTWSDKASRMYQSLWWKGDTYWLINVRVPISVLEEADDKHSMPTDDEGLVDCHVRVKAGNVVETSLKAPASSWFRTIDCQYSILMPCFSDPHTHLIKTQTVPRNRNHRGTISEALEAEAADQPRWKSPNDVLRRMHFAAQCAVHHGTRAIRTHLDGCASEDSEVADAVWSAFDEIQDNYQDVLTIQGVANLYLPLWLTDMARAHADRASQHKNTVLGAYVGKNATGNRPDREFVDAFDALFSHASRLGMDVDLHIDESSDPACCALASLCESLSKARRKGYQRRVVLGHCCALSLQDTRTKEKVCKQLSVLDAFVVANPFTNLGLQDRRGGKAPHSLEYPAHVPRTPQWRGLTLLQELRAAGVPVASASDNVRDHWYPFGDLDMLPVWKMTTELSHVELIAGRWADLVTTAPAEAMGLTHSVGLGQAADFILFPNARRVSELFSRPQSDRLVLRKGRVQATRLPDFSDLDDLVEVTTNRAGSSEHLVRTLSA